MILTILGSVVVYPLIGYLWFRKWIRYAGICSCNDKTALHLCRTWFPRDDPNSSKCNSSNLTIMEAFSHSFFLWPILLCIGLVNRCCKVLRNLAFRAANKELPAPKEPLTEEMKEVETYLKGSSDVTD